jgi:nucleoside-diphosphate-sugar epimerase
MTTRTVVLGASGLLGATLTEMLVASGRPTRAVIHSAGNAWRLARLGIDLHQADILNPTELTRALDECDVLVNCTRGGPQQMIHGFKAVLHVARTVGVRRLIHISSVAAYGEPPDPLSFDESGPTEPAKNTYGWYKLQQDKMVQRAAAGGLPSVVLCPPNIIGAYAYFPMKLLDTLSNGTFAFVEGGSGPCNTVDVVNLCHAIRLAIASGIADGRRLFVTDDEPTNWRHLVEPLLSLVPTVARPHSLSGSEALALSRVPAEKPATIARSVKHLISSDMRAALRKDPLLAKVDTLLRKTVARFGGAFENQLRLAVEGPTVVRSGVQARYDTSLLSMQLRSVRHSCARAKAELGYTPLVTVEQSMEAFTRWTRQSRGMDERSWQLARELYF